MKLYYFEEKGNWRKNNVQYEALFFLQLSLININQEDKANPV